MSTDPREMVRKARLSYEQGELDERLLGGDPIAQFELWMRAAIEAGIEEPNAMSLATASGDGEPDVRIVLLRGGMTASAEELVALVRERKGPVATPKSVEFRETLALTALGKLDKKAMRAPYWAGRDRQV